MFDIFISGVLKVLIHFIELKKFSRVNMLKEVASVVSNVGMLYLVVFLFIMLESPLISTFYRNMVQGDFFPFKEMTIMLDDVSCLFHIPIPRDFFFSPLISIDLMSMSTDTYLEDTQSSVL